MKSTKKQEATNDAAAHLQTFPTAIIAAIVRGEIDLDALAREELVSRGCGLDGKWVGFDAAIDAVPAPGIEDDEPLRALLIEAHERLEGLGDGASGVGRETDLYERIAAALTEREPVTKKELR
jgi:hypothetical protein